MDGVSIARLLLLSEMLSRFQDHDRLSRSVKIYTGSSRLNCENIPHAIALVKDELARRVMSESHAARARRLHLNDVRRKQRRPHPITQDLHSARHSGKLREVNPPPQNPGDESRDV